MGRLTSPMTSLIIVTSMSHVKPYTRAPIGQQEPPQGEADLANDVINCYEYVTCLTIHQSSLRTAGTSTGGRLTSPMTSLIVKIPIPCGITEVKQLGRQLALG